MTDTKTLPQPGDLILYSDTTWHEPRWRVARVVAAGKVMWTIEHARILFSPSESDWHPPCKRKIGRWEPLRGDPVAAAYALQDAARARSEACRAADAAYLDAVRRIATGDDT